MRKLTALECELSCPFCQRPVAVDEEIIYCDDCNVAWHDERELAEDRRAVLEAGNESAQDAPGWSDVFAEDRTP